MECTIVVVVRHSDITSLWWSLVCSGPWRQMILTRS